MTKAEILEKMKEIVSTETGIAVSDISDTDTLDDLCSDSLEKATVITEFEEEFDIDFLEDQTDGCLPDMADIVEAKQHANNQS